LWPPKSAKGSIEVFNGEAAMISQRPDQHLEMPRPAAGTYEQLNIFGRPTGIRVNVEHGHPPPSAPLGHNRTLADDDLSRRDC
jgi:hypothetical protein